MARLDSEQVHDATPGQDAELQRMVGASLPTVAVVLAILYAALSPLHWLILQPPARLALTITASVSAAFFAAAYLMIRRRPPARRAHLLATGMAMVALFNATLMMALNRSPMQTSNFALILFGSASILLSRRWWLAIATMTVTAWVATIRTAAWSEEWTHFSFAFSFATVLSYAIVTMRIRTHRQLVDFKIANEHHKQRLEAALKETRGDLATAENKFRSLVEQALIGIVIISDHATFTYVNPAAARIMGYSAAEMMHGDFSVANIAHPDDRETVVENIKRRIRGDVRSLQYRFKLLRKDRQVIDVEVFGVVTEIEGRPAIVGTVTDISERLRYEIELQEKERELSTLISNLPGVVYRCRYDRDWTMEYLSEGIAKLTGYEAADFLGDGKLSFGDIIHPDDQDQVWEDVSKAIEARRPYQLQYRIRTKSGEERWVWEQGRGAYAADGTLLHLEGFISDITAQKRAELQVQKSESRLRLALEASDVGIWDLDVGSGHMEWTEGMSRLFGMPETKLEGRPEDFFPFIAQDEIKRIETAVRDAIEGRAPYQIEYRLPAAGGRAERWVAASGHLWRDEAGRPVRLMGYAQDISARKAYEKELREAKEHAEEANRLKSAIFANMSHEIRTPMTAILGYGEILSRRLHGTAMSKDIDSINLGGRRLLKLLNNVLDLARLEAGKASMSITGHPVSSSLTRVVELLRVLAAERGLTLTLDADPSLIVAGDSNAEEQIWTNIIGNAIKFTERGGVSVKAYRDDRVSPPAAVVTVTDTGVGIGPAFLPHAFEEFRQESEGIGRHFEGTGLGLPISKRLVEALGGSIGIASNKGKGTTVTVRLPLARTRTDESEPQIVETAARPPGVLPEILVVEDDPAARQLILRLLADGSKASAAGSGEEALAMADTKRFDRILMDINLKGSGLSGLDLLTQLRQRPAYRDIPIIAVTAYAMEGDRERFLKAGFNGYLAKPFNATELHNAVFGFA